MIKDMKELRKEYGYTQEQLANLLDVSVDTVRKWESGRNNPGRRSRKDIKNLFPTFEEIDNLFNEEEL